MVNAIASRNYKQVITRIDETVVTDRHLATVISRVIVVELLARILVVLVKRTELGLSTVVDFF